jgi:uncharacterized protein YabN with tetrapyrrole methylase and pyrophosphatase domain
VEEELAEVRSELSASAATNASAIAPDQKLEEELGDLLFAVVNLCRKANVHASVALDRANMKFVQRFQGIERLAAARGIDVRTAGLEVLDGLWDEVKKAAGSR